MTPRDPAAIANRLDFRVLAEADGYLVVDKPAPLLVHPSTPCGPRTLWHELTDLLAYELVNGGKISIINRLDRETSGVVLVATRTNWARVFGLKMQRRQMQKTYLALVWGWPEEDGFTVNASILRKGEVEPSEIWLQRLVHPAGQASCTEVQVLERFTRLGQPFSLVRVHPLTGRMHQIRLHLQHAGHAIVGDKIYGPSHRCYLDFIEHGWTPDLARQLLLPRHALHASELAVEIDGQETSWIAPWPEDLRGFHGGEAASNAIT